MKKDSITRKILLAIAEKALEKISDFSELGRFIINPHEALRGRSLYIDNYSPAYYRKAIFGLKRYGYLEEKGPQDQKKLYFTQKGRTEIIRNLLKDKQDRELKWDGKWRAIIFDIPEVSKKDRDFLRRELKWIGFKELQKSVWVFPYPIKKELLALLKLWKTEFQGDIRFLTTEDMDDKDLREFFGL